MLPTHYITLRPKPAAGHTSMNVFEMLLKRGHGCLLIFKDFEEA
jgi:hypothetical protein